MMLSKSLAMVLIGAMAVACTNGASPSTSGGGSSPVTESESGLIVGQPVEVNSFTVEVTNQSSALFIVTGSVPSRCHEANFGFEEPNADGVMIGQSESWLDPECDAAAEPTGFSETMQIDGLPPGDYVANLDEGFEASFVIPTQATSPPSTAAIEKPPPSDLSLVDHFVEFAKTPSDEGFSHLPLAGSVDLGLGPQLVRSVDTKQLRDPGAWVLHVEDFRAHVGPFSPLSLLESLDDYMVQVGEHPHCAGPPQPPPDGLEDYRRVSVQPSDDSIDSCLAWTTVDLFVGPSGLVEAITMDVWEP